MPVKRGQGQTTRWYQICFVPSGGDSSDDSDTESVILAHSTPTPTTTTWQELSAPESSSPLPPPNPEPQIDWRFPPPPPPPPNPDPQIDWRFPPPPPLPPNPEPQIDRRFPPRLPNPEPQIDWRFPPSPPPPPNPEPQIDRRFPPPPTMPPNPEPQIDWRFPPPPPPPPNSEPQINRRFPPPPPSPPRQNIWEWLPFDIELRHDRYQQQQQPQSPSHELGANHQSVNFLQVPIDVISRVRISGLHEIENLSHSHCPICLENFKVGDRACRLPCIHIYCSECILRWLNNNKTCPVCRLQLNDWESQSGSNSISDDHSLELETEILQMQQPIQTNSVSDWEFFFPPSPGSSVIENGAGDNSEGADYDSACDELGDSHEDRGYIVGASQSGHS